MENTKPSTAKAGIDQSKESYNNKKYIINTGLIASYHIRPGNGEGLFWFWRFINLSLTYLLTYLNPGQENRGLNGVLYKL